MFEHSELFFFRRGVYFLADFYVVMIFLLRFFILGKNEDILRNTPLLVFDSLPLLIEGIFFLAEFYVGLIFFTLFFHLRKK